MNSIYATAVTGMRGADFALEVAANNIANLNTSGFETVEPELASLPAEPEIGDQNNGIAVPASTHVGMGVQPQGTARSQERALLVSTGNPLDLALNADQFFTMRGRNGQPVYASQVSLHLEPDGQVVGSQALPLLPPVHVPAGVEHIEADSSGRIVGTTRSGQVVQVGSLDVKTFAAPENLTSLGDGLYAETFGSGSPRSVPAGQPQIASGYQLKSSVDLSTQMVDLIGDQRMYEANTKALQTMDALVNGIVNLQVR